METEHPRRASDNASTFLSFRSSSRVVCSWICRCKAAVLPALTGLLGLGLFSGCAGDKMHHLVVSAAEQRMAVLDDGIPIAEFPVSTSKFGLGDIPGSYATPLGRMRIHTKIGDAAPHGAVFKSRRLTGEILQVNAPGRDPIVTRILWLEGLEPGNRNAFRRYIYIHGTPEERTIGTPTSYGCIRMRSRDVVQLFDKVGEGARVTVIPGPLPQKMRVPEPLPAS